MRNICPLCKPKSSIKSQWSVFQAKARVGRLVDVGGNAVILPTYCLQASGKAKRMAQTDKEPLTKMIQSNKNRN